MIAEENKKRMNFNRFPVKRDRSIYREGRKIFSLARTTAESNSSPRRSINISRGAPLILQKYGPAPVVAFHAHSSVGCARSAREPCGQTLSLRFLAASKENSLRAITFVERTVCSFTFDEREG